MDPAKARAVKVNGTEWDEADLTHTAQVVKALQQEAQRDHRTIKEPPTPDALPVTWAVLDHLLTQPVPSPTSPSAVSWFWLTQTLAHARGRSSIAAVVQRWPGSTHESSPDLWAAAQAWGLDPLARIPSQSSARAVWELCCEDINPMHLAVRDRWPQPPAFVWANQHAPDDARAFFVRQGWKEIERPVTSDIDADSVYRRLELACLPKDAQDAHGTRVKWALVNRHPKVLLKLMEWAKPDFQQDRSGQGHDLWWAALGAPHVQNNFTNKVLMALKRLGKPEVGPEGKGWLVAHPEWLQNLTFYAQVQGGPRTNQAMRRNLRAEMAKEPRVAWAGTEADHQALVQRLWSDRDGPHAARELVEWALWMMPVAPEAPWITPSLRGWFVQCLAACISAKEEELKLLSTSSRDPDLWKTEQAELAHQRLQAHLRLPFVLPEGLPSSPDWQTLLLAPRVVAITRAVQADAAPALERRRSRYRA